MVGVGFLHCMPGLSKEGERIGAGSGVDVCVHACIFVILRNVERETGDRRRRDTGTGERDLARHEAMSAEN